MPSPSAATSLTQQPTVSTQPPPTASMPPPEPVVLHCPADMVKVKESLCIDRYELALVDATTERALSPYYPIVRDYDGFLAARREEAERYLARDAGTAAEIPFPELPAWQKRGSVSAKAVSRKGVIPSAHLTMAVAKSACGLAGKRLCTLAEWQTACRGEGGTKQPYGDEFKNRSCNVFREEHPGHVLFGDASVGMQDPRMGMVEGAKGPLLRRTGQTTTCASRWGTDAAYDMVGNLDEWVDDPDGTFAGGFFSRATRDGCERIVIAHGPDYRDYSTGGRCCKDAQL